MENFTVKKHFGYIFCLGHRFRQELAQVVLLTVSVQVLRNNSQHFLELKYTA